MNPILAAINLPPWGIAVAVAIFVMISLLMIGVILLQRPQGGGLTAAFGGSQGAGQTAFGTKTGDALTIFTCVVFTVYVGAAVFLNHAAKPQSAEAAPVAPAPATETTTSTSGNSASPDAANSPAPAITPTLTPIADPTKVPPTEPAATPATTPAATPAIAPATAPPATNPELPKTPDPKTPEPAPTTPPGQPK